MYHTSVMLSESVDGLQCKSNGTYVDATFGGGGHSKKIMEQLGPQGRLIAFDQDEDAKNNRIDDERFLLICQNFRFIKQYLKLHNIQYVDGILADLGVSSHQFDKPERGFSIRFEAALDMRMSNRSELTAGKILNTYTQEQLRDLFYQYGELTNATSISSRICQKRTEVKIETLNDLKVALGTLIPKNYEHKFLAKVFQALRIEVNKELDALKDFLKQTPDLLKEKGRLCVLSYHSLEDRLAKRFINTGNFEGVLEKDFYGNINKPLKAIGKVQKPSMSEVSKNNRARSAKLRIAEKK